MICPATLNKLGSVGHLEMICQATLNKLGSVRSRDDLSGHIRYSLFKLGLCRSFGEDLKCQIR